MNLIDLLLKLQIPLWVVLLLSILGIMGARYYAYSLDKAREKSSTELEHSLAIQKMEYEKALDLVQERYRSRLDAIDKVNAAIRHFDHALGHVRIGDAGEHDFESLQENYSLARKLAREYESLLGNDFYKLVERQTTEGIKILDATLSITQEKVDHLSKSGISEGRLKTLVSSVEKPIPL